MKLLLSSLLFSLTHAFPAAVIEAAQNDPAMRARINSILESHSSSSSPSSPRLAARQQGADAANALFEPIPIFDAEKQYIDVSPGSGHEWVAPSGDDLRGPCPGLNAFANHGFLPHNGYATVGQFIDVTTEIVGMGLLLATFLSFLGSTLDGDLVAWSIAGTPSAAQSGLLGPLGNGLSGSHNKYEGDASPTRPDLYQEGNNYMTSADQFQQLIDYSPGGIVTLDSLTSFRSHRFDTQIATNPYFFNGPFSGVLVQPAAYTFIYRFMANHSEEDPIGRLSYETIQSWFGIEGESGSYTAKQGYERIPDNWYRRALVYPYEVDYFMVDVVNAALLHPKFLDIGGNTGEVGTFTGVNLNNLTGGVFDVATLLEGNNLGCFAFQVAAQAKPDVALTLVNDLESALGAVLAPLSCPQLMEIETSQLADYPGFNKTS